MADFCKPCSIKMFGKDFHDIQAEAPGYTLTALCEGCGGYVTVDHEGDEIEFTDELGIEFRKKGTPVKEEIVCKEIERVGDDLVITDDRGAKLTLKNAHLTGMSMNYPEGTVVVTEATFIGKPVNVETIELQPGMQTMPTEWTMTVPPPDPRAIGIEALSDLLIECKRAYYTNGEPFLSDYEYDALENMLRKLDKDHPTLQMVGAPEE